jgi:phage baseplate assembly protein W
MEIRGFAFPFRFDDRTGSVTTVTGSEKIRQNIVLILGTRMAERPMMRDFGTRLAALVHDPNDDVLADLIRNQVRNALLQWEPRVLVTGARVEQREGLLKLFLTYVMIQESRTERMVVPLG